MKVVIIGNGVAGIFSAQHIRALDKEAEIEIYSQEEYPYYTRIKLPELISEEVTIDKLTVFNISGNKYYLSYAKKAWDFIETYFVDRKNGEWFYEIKEDGLPKPKHYKVSEWKGPYHNMRACLEIIKRLNY